MPPSPEREMKRTGMCCPLCIMFVVFTKYLCCLHKFFTDISFVLVKHSKKNLWIKLIFPSFRVTFDVMTVIMVVTAGEYLMEITSEFVARTFAMINQRCALVVPHFLDNLFGS